MTSSIPENLAKVRQQIAHFEQKYARIDTPVQLIAVSKTHPASMVKEAVEAGQHHFGENYLQEALEKIYQLSEQDITWHFIGPIQSNKTRDIAAHCQWVHSVDRLKIARRLSKQRPAELLPLNVLLQVNIDDECSKSGVAVEELPQLAADVSEFPNLVLAGLMAIPAPTTDHDRQRQAYSKLRDARDQLLAAGFTDCVELSMGMSNDFEAAIAEGATMIRIGTNIFGPREGRLQNRK